MRTATFGIRAAAEAGAIAAAFGRALARVLAAERHRWALWLPVALGLGIGAYFELDREPPLWASLAPVPLVAALAFAARRRTAPVALALAGLAAALGFAAAKLHSDAAAAPILKRGIGPVSVEGRVVDVEPTPKGLRATIEPAAISGLAPAERPHRIRITFRPGIEGFAPGDRIAIRAMLMPPAAPAAPGAYDFQRQAWFQRIGAVGFALGKPSEVGKPQAGLGFRVWLDRQRLALTERVVGQLEAPIGALAAAQITGHRGAIPPEVMTAMQDSGLAHLLAISGMNIGIVAGLIFFMVRGLLALVPPLALRWPIKKIAAVAAMAGAGVYVLISGASVPTQRAWIMFAAIMIGILADREALSMRLCAWAAGLILLAAPDALLGASFQMSFAAVVALIACYERFAVRARAGRAPPPGLAGTAWRWTWGIALTSLIAGLATAPFGIYSFNRVAVYGLAANMIAVPVTDLIVMPAGLFAMLLMPLGLEHWPLQVMGWGIEIVHGVARTVASWPGAVLHTTVLPGWGLLIFALGGLWCCLWLTPWRWLGVPVMALGLASLALHQPPDILVSSDDGTVAVRAPDGSLVLARGGARGFQVETWQRRDANAPAATWAKAAAPARAALACDAQACLYRAKGEAAILFDPAALAEECRAGAVLIAPALAAVGCKPAAATVDRTALARNGTYALWLTQTGGRYLTDRAVRGERPWVRYPESRAPLRARSAAGRTSTDSPGE